MMRLQSVHAHMTQRRVDAGEHFTIAADGSRPQLLFGIVHEPLFRKLGKLDIAVKNLTVSALFLEKHSLPVEFLLQLALGHARFGCPCQVTAYLFAVQIVATGNGYLVAVAALLDCCHGQTSFSISRFRISSAISSKDFFARYIR